jgi:hypothetical protein
MAQLIHLIYASCATRELGPNGLTDILQKSRELNKPLGITGMLLHSDDCFFQVLEGEAATVDTLYEKLDRDKRHQQLTLIIREPIAKRSFAEWSMGFSSATPEELAKIHGLNDFFEAGSCFSNLDAGRAKKLLAAFAEGHWHSELLGIEPQEA